jgi:hypothetical protein
MSQNFKGNDRGVSLYNMTKARYENTVPIRGKRAAENIRPIGYRNRTWERLVEDVRVVKGKEETWYGYRLYETDVVMLSPTGIIEFNTDGWESNSTAQFIHWVGRVFLKQEFGGRKYKNKIWVTNSHGAYRHENFEYPIFGKTAFQTGTVENDDGYEVNTIKPLKEIKEKVPVIDRKKMKEAMTPYMPMVNYLNSMVKLTSGLLSYDLRKGMAERIADNHWRESYIYKFSVGCELEEWNYYRHNSSETEMMKLLDIAKNGTEDDWMKLLFVMRQTFEYKTEKVGEHMVEVKFGNDQVHTNRIEHIDYRIDVRPTAIREKVAKWVKQMDDSVWTSKIVNHGL